MNQDVGAIVAATVRETVQAIVPEIVAALIAGVPAKETVVPESTPADAEHARVDAQSVRDAASERARWDAMAPDELAELETAAARTRYTDAIVDVLERNGDTALIADLAAALPADQVASCRAVARQRLAGNPTAQARIDAGLKSRADELVELVEAVTSGKASTEQRGRFVELVAAR